MNDQRFNTYLGVGIFVGTILLVSFGAALLGSKAGEVAAALATVVSGSFVVGAAVIAWRSVQQQIASAENIEATRRKSEISGIEIGFTNEMLVYSSGVIQATSIWNRRAIQSSQEIVVAGWPVFIDPLYYKTNIGKIGLVRQPWVIGAIIGFYTNILELNEQAREFFAGRPTINVTSRSISARMRVMASNLSQAIDGLNDDRKFPIPQEIQLDQLFMPNGQTLSECSAVPQNLQDVLLRLAGIIAANPVSGT